MARRWIVAGVIVAVFVGVGVGAALLTREDDGAGSAAPSTTTTLAPRSTTTTAVPEDPTPTSTSTTAPPPPTVPDPCGAETAAIRGAIEIAVEGARDGAELDTCRLAAIDPAWALARLVARAGAAFEPVNVLLQGGGGVWTVIDVGPATVGCGRAPQQVLVDLGMVCASGGGGL
jgi:hypothetical protein